METFYECINFDELVKNQKVPFIVIPAKAGIQEIQPLNKVYIMPKILIVDDDFTIGMEIEEMLTALGYDVVGQAGSGQEAVKMAQDLKPDIILMDIVMPGEMSGIDAAEKIKAELDIPIIFISGYGDSAYVERAKQIEPFGYVMKPFDEKEVRAFIEIALHKRKIELKLKKAHDRLEKTNGELRREIKERKETEKTLEASEQKYRTLVDNIMDGVYILNTEGRFTFVNDVIVDRSAHPREWFLNRSYLDVISPEHRKRVEQNFKSVMSGDDVPVYSLSYPKADGNELSVEINTVSLIEDGEIVGLLGVSRDSTARKRAEEALKESHDRFLLLLDSLDAAVYVADMETYEILFMNKYIKNLFGDRAGEICWKAFHHG